MKEYEENGKKQSNTPVYKKILSFFLAFILVVIGFAGDLPMIQVRAAEESGAIQINVASSASPTTNLYVLTTPTGSGTVSLRYDGSAYRFYYKNELGENRDMEFNTNRGEISVASGVVLNIDTTTGNIPEIYGLEIDGTVVVNYAKVETSDDTAITVNASGQLTVNGELEATSTGDEAILNYGTVTVSSGATLKGSIYNSKDVTIAQGGTMNGDFTYCQNLTVSGTLNGSLACMGGSTTPTITVNTTGKINAENIFSNWTVKNYGEISASELLQINGNNVSSDSNGTFVINSAGDLDLSGYTSATWNCGYDIIVSKETKVIKRSEGAVELNVKDGIQGLIMTGTIPDGVLVREYFSPTIYFTLKDAFGNTISEGSTLYYGSDVIPTVSASWDRREISNPSITYYMETGYSGGIKREWNTTDAKLTGISYGSGYPFAVWAEIPGKEGTYLAGKSNSITGIKIIYYPINEIPIVEDGRHVYISGLSEDGLWCASQVTLTAPTGYLLGGSSSWKRSIKISKDDAEYADYYMISMKRQSDNATTAGTELSTWVPNISSINFDLIDPELVSSSVDGASFSLTDGAAITARKMAFTIGDLNLKKVTVDGKAYGSSDFTTDSATGQKRFAKEIIATPGTVTHTVVAEDMAGRTLSYTFDLTYTKDAVTAAASMSDVYYGLDYLPQVTTVSDQTADNYEYYYKPQDADDTAYTTTKPTAVGDYTVKVVIPATDLYMATEAEAQYRILYLPAPEPAYTIVGKLGENGHYTGTVTLQAPEGYLIAAEEQGEYAATVPFAKGMKNVYLKRVSDGALTGAVKITEDIVVEIKTTVSVAMENAYAGTDYALPVVTTNSDQKAENYIYTYKTEGASDDSYSAAKPKTVGSYVVRIEIPATENYTAASVCVSYKIGYLSTPEPAYSVKGTKGKNEYYTTDVTFVAPKGYQIAASESDTFSDTVTYKDGMTKVYLRRSEDGALTDAVTVGTTYKVDKELPTVSGSGTLINKRKNLEKAVTVSDGMDIYADTLQFTLADDHLDRVMVDGDDVTVSNGKAEVLLDSQNRTKKFKIEAEDLAGNVTTMNVTLKAGWQESSTVLPGSPLELEGHHEYFWEPGYWSVNGDSTLYKGGGSFFVAEPGDYTFTKK